MRIAVPQLGAQADLVEHRGDARVSVPAARDAVQPQRLGDDVADGHPRVERRVRILEDHVHVPPQRPHPRGARGA